MGLSISAFLLMTGDGMVLALLPQQVISLTNSSLHVGYLASIYAFAQVLTQLPIGILADRIGHKYFIIMGYVLSLLAGLLYYFTNDVTWIFLGRILQGIGEVPILSVVPALLSNHYSHGKGKAIGVYNAAIYLGLTTGPLIKVILLKEWSDHQVFLFYAATCFLGAVINYHSLQNEIEGQYITKDILHLSSLLTFLKNPRILWVLLGITLYGAGFGIFMTTIPAFFILVKNYDQSFINMFFFLFYIAIGLSQLITGWLSDRLGRWAFMAAGMMLAAVGLGISSLFEHFGLTVILAVASFGLGTFYLASMAFLNENVSAASRGAISGTYYLFWGIGMFIGPLILELSMGEENYSFGIHMFAGLLALEALMLFCRQGVLLRWESQ